MLEVAIENLDIYHYYVYGQGRDLVRCVTVRGKLISATNQSKTRFDLLFKKSNIKGLADLKDTFRIDKPSRTSSKRKY